MHRRRLRGAAAGLSLALLWAVAYAGARCACEICGDLMLTLSLHVHDACLHSSWHADFVYVDFNYTEGLVFVGDSTTSSCGILIGSPEHKPVRACALRGALVCCVDPHARRALMCASTRTPPACRRSRCTAQTMRATTAQRSSTWWCAHSAHPHTDRHTHITHALGAVGRHVARGGRRPRDRRACHHGQHLEPVRRARAPRQLFAAPCWVWCAVTVRGTAVV